MRPEVKAQWIAALRSGEYQQGRSFLRYGDKYCCLGVLCELAVNAGAAQQAKRDDEDSECIQYDGSDALLPDSVVEWAGLTEDDVMLEWSTDGTTQTDWYASRLNDRGLPFSKLAGLIEAQL